MMRHLASSDSESELSVYEPDQVQPNAIDLKVDKIFTIESTKFTISEEQKVHRGSTELVPDNNGFWHLETGVYEIIMEGEITIGPNEAGFVITR